MADGGPNDVSCNAMADCGLSECPICFVETASTECCRTPCHHVFCVDCFTRVLRNNNSSTCGSCPMCRKPVSLFSTLLLHTREPLRAPAVDSIVGSVYVHSGGEDIGSYHFDTLEAPYMRYAAANGSQPLEREYFEEPAYDAASRTFRGTIRWRSPFRGAARWEYEMRFADSFGFICGGQMRAFDASGTQIDERRYVEAMAYWRKSPPPGTIFGQAFMQGGRLGLASYHFISNDEMYISYESAPDAWRMDDGSPPPARKPFESPAYDAESRTFRGNITWSPAPFNGDSRWEYEMVFSEDFNSILGGRVRAFDAGGRSRGSHRFGTDLFYERCVEEVEELRSFLRSGGVAARYAQAFLG